MKKKILSLFLVVALLLTCLAGCSSNESKDVYPTKNINAICPYGAGGTTDLAMRGLFDAVAEDAMPSGTSFVVSNVSGGSGLVGASQFANSNADGYTIGVVNCDLVLNKVLGNTEISVDQFTPLVAIQTDPYMVIVRDDSPFKTFEELVDYALEHPGEVSIGDTGEGGVPHLAVTALEKNLGLSFKSVSYDSSGDSVVAVVSGEVDATISHSAPAAGQLDAGGVKAIAVTSNERLSTYPDVPAIGELYDELSDMQVMSWIFVVTLKDAPEESVTFLRDVFGNAIKSDKFQKTLASFYMQKTNLPDSKAMIDFIDNQYAYYQTLVK